MTEQQQAQPIRVPIGPVAVILTLGLMFFKITGIATYSWWWVFAPVLAAVGLVATLTILGAVLLFVVAAVVHTVERAERRAGGRR